MADFEAWLVFLILVVNVVGELQRKRTLAASRGFLAAARLSCYTENYKKTNKYLYNSVNAHKTLYNVMLGLYGLSHYRLNGTT